MLTCPAGTIGNVSRTTSVTMRNCTSRELNGLLIVQLSLDYSYMHEGTLLLLLNTWLLILYIAHIIQLTVIKYIVLNYKKWH